MKPFNVKQNTPDETTVPCGKCPACLSNRASAWSFRLMEEAKVSNAAVFVTLTYDTEHVPISKNGFMTLDKTDLQKFMKRLRWLQNDKGIKYYAVGEYGGKTHRPHYHIILFNAQVELIEQAWALDNKRIGDIHIGDVSGASVGYTLKYISKPKKIPMHMNDDRLTEFSLMSKGIGKSYLSPAQVRWHKNDMTERMYCETAQGVKLSMPRYYKQKIYSDDERKVISIAVQTKQAKEIYKEFQNITAKEFATKQWNKKQSIENAYRKHKKSIGNSKI